MTHTRVKDHTHVAILLSRELLEDKHLTSAELGAEVLSMAREAASRDPELWHIALLDDPGRALCGLRIAQDWEGRKPLDAGSADDAKCLVCEQLSITRGCTP